MPRKGARVKKGKLAATARAAAQNRRLDSFEPDMNVPEIRHRAAEDDTDVNECPMTDEERAQDAAQVESKQQMLTMAMDKDAQERQKQPFLGSVVDHLIMVARDAEAVKAQDMEHADWTHFHEEMYAKYLPFSAACYKLFRRAAQGGALQDADFVRLLVIGRAREKRGDKMQSVIDEMTAKYITKTQMYTQMRADIEQKRREHTKQT